MVHEQAAGFALDALDPGDVRDFEQHLEGCPNCEDALEPFRLAAVALAFAGELPRPRPELRLRVLDVGGVAIPLRRRCTLPLLSAGAAAAACAALVVALHGWGGDAARRSVAGLHAYTVRGADGTLLVARTGEAVLVVPELPSPGAGTTYELWVIDGGRPVAAGFLRGRLGTLTRPVPPGAAVAVSIEPTGGSRRPTGPLLLEAETA
jgi:hypothetical protein